MRPRELGLDIHPRHYVMGVDLGQAQDPTAVVVVETELTKRVVDDGMNWGAAAGGGGGGAPGAACWSVCRWGWRIRTQVAHVRGTDDGAGAAAGAELVIDMTGWAGRCSSCSSGTG